MFEKEVELLSEITIQYMEDSRSTPDSTGALGEIIRQNLPDDDYAAYLSLIHEKALAVVSDALEKVFADA